MFKLDSIQLLIAINLRLPGWNCVTILAKRYGNDTNAIAKIIGIIPTGFIGIGSEDDSSTFHLLAYTIGISLVDLSINMDNNTKPSTITSIKTITHRKLLAEDTSP